MDGDGKPDPAADRSRDLADVAPERSPVAPPSGDLDMAEGDAEGDSYGEEEEGDELGPLDPSSYFGLDPELAKQIMLAKQNNPSQFASHWEMDEMDVEEATEEEILNNPATRMLWAAEKGKEDVVRELIELDRHLVNTRDKDQYTPLHRAAYENLPQIVELLLENGAEVGARTIDGWTPLHSACHWNNTEAARMLIAYSADVNSRTTKSGMTPLHFAASCKTEDKSLLELLLFNKDLDPHIKDISGETARELCERNNPFSYLFDIVEDFITKLHPD